MEFISNCEFIVECKQTRTDEETKKYEDVFDLTDYFGLEKYKCFEHFKHFKDEWLECNNLDTPTFLLLKDYARLFNINLSYIIEDDSTRESGYFPRVLHLTVEETFSQIDLRHTV